MPPSLRAFSLRHPIAKAGAAEDFGGIRIALESAGRRIGPYDLLIAAHTRHISATFVTNNKRKFRRVPRLAVQNWLKS